MKKILAAVLAAAMLAGMNVTAFAATTTETVLPLANFTGQPINEDGKQYADGDNIEPNQTIYFMIPDAAKAQLNDSKISKLTVKKVKNSKLVKSVTLVEKKLASGSGVKAKIPTGGADGTVPTNPALAEVTLSPRHTYIAVTLNDMTDADELKVELSLTFSGRTSTTSKYAEFPLFGATDNKFKFKASGEKLTFKTSFYVSNPTEDGEDASVNVGKKGMTIKPAKNTTNEIIFDNDVDTMATLTFKASSNPSKFYAKMTTNWSSDLLAKFKDTDAVIRRFSPATIDTTSRGVLALNNPFDEDEYDLDRVYIYSVDSKNKITNVTSSFSYNDDDDTFETKTRKLGTWIISDVKIKLPTTTSK